MKTFILLLSTFFLMISCGVSPLFNHENADDVKRKAPLLADATCPLSFPHSALCAKIEWIVGPTGEEENSFLIKFWDKDAASSEGPYLDPGHEVAAQLWMPSMGHGSSPVTVLEQSAGVYKATKVYFTMPGAWDLRVKLKDGNTLVEQATQPVKIE